MSRSTRAWYQQMIAAGRSGERLVAHGRAAFDQDELLQRAAKNICLELGEAAKQIMADDAAELSRVAYQRWPVVVRMRDFYGHNYPVTDLDVLWETIRTDLPEITLAVENRVVALDGPEVPPSTSP